MSTHDSLPQLLVRKPETPSAELTPSAPSTGLPAELVALAGRRLAFAALTYAAVYAISWVIAGAALSMGAMEGMGGEREPWDTLTLVFVTLSLGMWALARSGRVAPATLLDVALVYEVIGAVGIDIGLIWPPPGATIEAAAMLTWTAVWIVIFPLLVPATPGKALVASLIAASVKPLFVLIAIARGFPAPAPGSMLLVAFPNYVCALLAFSASRVVYGLSREVGRARRLGSYRLIDRLGSGGMGEVWRAERGLDADSLVRRFGPQPAERVVHVLRQVCESLAEAHRAGLVHRDIKPANVFLCRRGLVHDFVKVLDFGLVKAAAGAGRAETALTRQHVTTGTPAFMPPEMATGEADVDGRADVYAVGCLAYWLLTGTLVFEGSEMQMAVAHAGAAPKRPSQRTERSIPPDLEALVMDCLEKDRDRRPQSAVELARQLDALPVEPRWDHDTAAAWWRSNLPDLAA